MLLETELTELTLSALVEELDVTKAGDEFDAVVTDEDAEVTRRLVVVFVRKKVLEDVVLRTVVVMTVVKKYERLVNLDADTLEEDDADAEDPAEGDE